MRWKALATLALPAAVLTLAAAGGAALPGGTSFEVHVTSPADGAVLPEATPITVTGQATVGAAAPIANTRLITAIDVSGSTRLPVSTAACQNQNPSHDTAFNTVLDCELAAAKELNKAAFNAGTVAQVGLIGFAGRQIGTSAPLANEAAPLDLTPGGGAVTLVFPGIDSNGNGARDPEEAIASAYNDDVAGTVGQPPGDLGVGFTQFSTFTSSGNTNYWAAVTAIRQLAALAGPPTITTKVAVMLSDGDATVGGPANQPVGDALLGIAATGLHIWTFAIGNAASCAGSGSPYGTLQQIADASGATCTHIANPADAISVVPAAIGSTIFDFKTSQVGEAGPFDAASGAAVPPATFLSPGVLKGPGSVNISHTYPGSAPGPRTFCVQATGQDGGGKQTLTDCVNVAIKARPTVTFPGGPGGSAGTVPEGTAFPLSATVTDASTTQWAASGGTGTCTFGNSFAVNTSITCDDNGVYTLTLTAHDGVNPDTVASETLTVTNVPPTAALTLTPTLVPLSSGNVGAHVEITDPGTGDTFQCIINWGDGSTNIVPATGSACDTSHQYLTAGSYAVHAIANDDDGGSGTDDGHVTVQAPPTVTLPGDGPFGYGEQIYEGGLFVIAGSAPGAASVQWTSSGGTGTCTFDFPNTASTSGHCNDDGLYTMTLTATDSFGQTTSASQHVLVLNLSPSVGLTLTPGLIPVGGSTAAHVSFFDPGHDTWNCVIAWGDGSTTVVPATGTTCDAPHTYATAGTQNVLVHVTDDDGGDGTASGTVEVKGPPAITIDGDGPNGTAGRVNEGSPFIAHASVGGSTSFTWTATGPGTCTVEPVGITTDERVRCFDNGVFTLTLTAVDQFGQTSSAVEHLQVDNVSPTLTVSSPVAGGSPRNVVFNGIVTDPGTDDVLSCLINWGDGTTNTVPVVGGFCTLPHTYADAVTSATVDAVATDDDGGASAHVLRALTFNRPPMCLDVASSDTTLWPPNHQLELIQLSGATDPDPGDSASITVTGVRQDEALTGNGSGNFSPDARIADGGVYLRVERDGTGDGRVYTIAFTATDTHGASCNGTVRVTVAHDQAHAAHLTPGVSVNSLG
jgi:hypothetical protein